MEKRLIKGMEFPSHKTKQLVITRFLIYKNWLANLVLIEHHSVYRFVELNSGRQQAVLVYSV